MITRSTTYGLPSDPFTRIVEDRSLSSDGKTLTIKVTQYNRAPIEQITVTVATPESTP